MLTKVHIQTLRRLPTAENRLAKAAQLGGITRSDLARDLGFTQSYVGDVSRSRYRTITLSNARKFAKYFSCSVDDLFPV
jgi:transcriptional regulator with XRE-family HTH domain